MAVSRNPRAGVVLLIISTLRFCAAASPVEFAGGSGELNDPYQIATAGQLIAMGHDPNLMDRHFILVADIDLNPNLLGGRVFDQAVIGNCTNVAPVFADFRGRFDGNGHIIRNLVLRANSSPRVGLFSDLCPGARVQRLGIVNADIQGTGSVGILAGENAGTIEACYTTGTVRCLKGSQGWKKAVAEIAGQEKAMWEEMEAIYGPEQVRHMYRDLLERKPDDDPAKLGGLVGINHRFIESCYSAAAVHATCADGNSAEAGGLAGANSGRIRASYSCGQVTGNAGGLVGRNAVRVPLSPEDAEGQAFFSYWDVQASGATSSGAGVGKTGEQMKRQTSFEGWDFENVWMICEGRDYPRLRWEGARCPE